MPSTGSTRVSTWSGSAPPFSASFSRLRRMVSRPRSTAPEPHRGARRDGPMPPPPARCRRPSGRRRRRARGRSARGERLTCPAGRWINTTAGGKAPLGVPRSGVTSSCVRTATRSTACCSNGGCRKRRPRAEDRPLRGGRGRRSCAAAGRALPAHRRDRRLTSRRDEAARRHPEINVMRCDVRETPYGDDTFDAVVSTSTLDHFDTVAGIGVLVLREQLTPPGAGGMVIVSLDNRANPLVALAKCASLPLASPHRARPPLRRRDVQAGRAPATSSLNRVQGESRRPRSCTCHVSSRSRSGEAWTRCSASSAWDSCRRGFSPGSSWQRAR